MFEVEKDWVTDAGFRAVVIMTDMGHRCGYVGLPQSHPLYGVDYSDESSVLTFPAGEEVGKRGIIPMLCAGGEKASPDVVFDVHGGLTYAGGRAEYPAPSDGLWWFGYDCGHAGDAPLPGSRMSEYKCADDVHRSLDYCIAECESLARQMVTRVTSAV